MSPPLGSPRASADPIAGQGSASAKLIVNRLVIVLSSRAAGASAAAKVTAMQAAASAAAPEPASPAASRVGYLVYRVERRLRSRLDEAVQHHGVTTTEYVTLSVLRQHDGMSGAELARWAFVTPQAMNAVVSKLERRRLVRRRRDPTARPRAARQRDRQGPRGPRPVRSLDGHHRERHAARRLAGGRRPPRPDARELRPRARGDQAAPATEAVELARIPTTRFS